MKEEVTPLSPLHFILSKFLSSDEAWGKIEAYRSGDDIESGITETLLVRDDLKLNLLWGWNDNAANSSSPAHAGLSFAWSLLGWFTQCFLPEIMESAGFPSSANNIRAFPPVKNFQDVSEIFRFLPSTKAIEERIDLVCPDEENHSSQSHKIYNLTGNLLARQSGGNAVEDTLLALRCTNQPLRRDGSILSIATEFLAAFGIADCSGFVEFQKAYGLVFEFVHKSPYPLGLCQEIAGYRAALGNVDNDIEDHLNSVLGKIATRLRQSLDRLVANSLDTGKQFSLD